MHSPRSIFLASITQSVALPRLPDGRRVPPLHRLRELHALVLFDSVRVGFRFELLLRLRGFVRQRFSHLERTVRPHHPLAIGPDEHAGLAVAVIGGRINEPAVIPREFLIVGFRIVLRPRDEFERAHTITSSPSERARFYFGELTSCKPAMKKALLIFSASSLARPRPQ